VGEHFRPALIGVAKTQVEFGGVQAQINTLGDFGMWATVPAGAVTGPITYIDSDGRATSSASFVVDRPPQLVAVPGVVGLSLQDASQRIQKAGLTIGQLSGATGFDLQVIGQDPGAGTKVPLGSPVNMTLAQVVTGIKSLTLFDALPSNSAYVWLYDSSTQQWSEQNNDQTLSPGESVTITLPEKRPYKVVAIDPSQCSANDPGICSAEWEWTFLGDPNGIDETQNMVLIRRGICSGDDVRADTPAAMTRGYRHLYLWQRVGRTLWQGSELAVPKRTPLGAGLVTTSRSAAG
jgi:hypothetical protein